MKQISGILIFFLVFAHTLSAKPNDSPVSLNLTDDYEKIKCVKKLKSFDASLKNLPMNELMVEVGKTFLETPYVAGTLDNNSDNEEITINITGLDCVTFVENCLIFSRLLKQNKTDFEDYREELEKIRYRNGKNTGYTSRLHYFTDWIHENEQKGIVKDLTPDIGGIEYRKKIDFMTRHSNLYKQLDNNDNNILLMDEVENNMNSRVIYFIPKEEINTVYDKLQSGDIIGITSSLNGLDIAHTALVYKKDGRTFLMHASLKNKEVEISSTEIQEYIMANQKQSGIVVARVLDVNK